MDCRCLFINLLASLNLLELIQFATGKDTFTCETSCSGQEPCVDLQQIQGGQLILAALDLTFECGAFEKGSYG